VDSAETWPRRRELKRRPEYRTEERESLAIDVLVGWCWWKGGRRKRAAWGSAVAGGP
jgi:hypothetical protein